MPGEWIRRPRGEATAVFVHGVLSSGETCWKNDDTGSYWPELLKNEPELGSLGIYVFTYETGIFSGSYSLSEIANQLKDDMQQDDVLKCIRLVFVCHSMGGIVVRKFIVSRAVELNEAKKEINLFLVASPSLGSHYADWLHLLALLFGHKQADALRFVQNNSWLLDLDLEFLNLKEGGKPKIKGKELVEHKFIKVGWKKIKIRMLTLVVERYSGAKYFADPRTIRGSDHFSIAKPADKQANQHRLLRQFILENALSSGSEERKPPPDPTPALAIPLLKTSLFTEYQTEEVSTIQVDANIMNAILKKMQSDFDNSKLSYPTSQKRAIDSSVKLLCDFGIAKKEILPVENISSSINSLSWAGVMSPEVFRWMKELSSITVQCVSVLPAAVATIINMKERGFNIQLFYNYPTGKELAAMLEFANDQPYDFLITGEPGTYLSLSEAVLGYRQILSISHGNQMAYEQIGSKSNTKILLYAPGTSGEEQIIAGVKLEHGPHEFDPILLSSLDDGECVLLWEPLRINETLQPLVGTEYEFRFSLFANKLWMNGNRKRDLIIFLNAFVASWNYLKRNMDVARTIIENERAYHVYFAIATGMDLRK